MVRAVDPPASVNYTIETFAGGATLPINVPAALAATGEVSAVAVAPSGDVYMALPDYHIVVRKDSSGLLTLVAGTVTGGYSGDNGPATSAQLKTPADLAFDSEGNLYISDDNRIRKVSKWCDLDSSRKWYRGVQR